MARSVKNLKLFENTAFSRKWNELLEEIERRTLNVVSPLYMSETAAGSMLSVIRQRGGGGGGAAAAVEPFTIFLTPQLTPPNFDITLQPGKLNQAVPSNMFTSAVYVPATTVFIYLTVTTNGKSVTGVTLTSSPGAPPAMTVTANAAPTVFYFLIGIVANSTIYQIWTGNIQANVTVVITEGQAVPVPGTSPFIFWYTWTPIAGA